ncbi:hypothetical protein Tco_0735530 [Tanacetum coccineum]
MITTPESCLYYTATISYVELEYNMEECFKALNDQLDWNNPEGDRYPFDLSKPLPLVQSRNRQIVLVDYFFNNDLAYLQGGTIDITYTTTLTKTNAAKYDLQRIEDMDPSLWSPIKLAYNIYALLGTSHLGPKDKNSTDMLLTGSDQKLYKFMEGDFPRLHLNDIENMLLIVVQNRLNNLNGEVIVHFAAALRFIYLDKLERNRLMCSQELYKFSDDTLISVRDKLKDMANNLEMGYTSVMPRRRWSNLDKKRSRIMVKDIDRQLLDKSPLGRPRPEINGLARLLNEKKQIKEVFYFMECVESALVYWHVEVYLSYQSPIQHEVTIQNHVFRCSEIWGCEQIGREPSQEINNHNIPILISPTPGPSRKRSRSLSSPFFLDAITLFDGKPASETSELNPEDVTARLEDLEVEVDTLHADTEDKELLISELQDSLASAENEIAIL